MAEQINKPVKKRPSVSTDQIRKFSYTDREKDVVQFDVRFPDEIDRTFVVRLDDGFTDQEFEDAIEARRSEAKSQKQLSEEARADVKARLDRVYPEASSGLEGAV